MQNFLTLRIFKQIDFFFNFDEKKLLFSLEDKAFLKLRNTIPNFNQTSVTQEFGEGFEDYM